jgi:MFS family permease
MMLLAASWVMTSITDSTVMVAMVQTAVSLPIVLFSIPFGLIGDRFGYRGFLIIAQLWMVIPASLLTVAAWSGRLRPWLLLILLFLMGIGMVMQKAAWTPMLYDVAPVDEAVAVVSLTSLGNKGSQAIGPLIGGYLMGSFGAASLFAIRALSHVIMLVTLTRVSRSAETPPAQRDSISDLRQSLAQGWRFTYQTPAIIGTLVRCVMLMTPWAGLLALLPLEAKLNIQTEVIGYGGLLTALGIGTVLSTSLMPILDKRVSMNALATIALFVFSLGVLGISRWDSMLLDASFLFIVGLSFGVLSVSQQATVQSSSPDDIRGQITSFYVLSVQGSMVAGSLLSGLLARYIGVSQTIMVCGFIAMSALLLTRLFPLREATE